MSDKILVYVTFDTAFNTWNVVNYLTGICLSYGGAWLADEWLNEHKETHKEVIN